MRKSDGFSHLLAILLCVTLITGNAGITVLAGDYTSEQGVEADFFDEDSTEDVAHEEASYVDVFTEEPGSGGEMASEEELEGSLIIEEAVFESNAAVDPGSDGSVPADNEQAGDVIEEFADGSVDVAGDYAGETAGDGSAGESSGGASGSAGGDGSIAETQVVFDAVPETAVVTVYLVTGNDDQNSIPAQEDGSFLLLPGEYTYTAEAEGYVSLENVPFTVTGDGQSMRFSFEMVANDEKELKEFDQSGTVNGVVVRVQAGPGVFPADAVRG